MARHQQRVWPGGGMTQEWSRVGMAGGGAPRTAPRPALPPSVVRPPPRPRTGHPNPAGPSVPPGPRSVRRVCARAWGGPPIAGSCAAVRPSHGPCACRGSTPVDEAVPVPAVVRGAAGGAAGAPLQPGSAGAAMGVQRRRGWWWRGGEGGGPGFCCVGCVPGGESGRARGAWGQRCRATRPRSFKKSGAAPRLGSGSERGVAWRGLDQWARRQHLCSLPPPLWSTHTPP